MPNLFSQPTTEDGREVYPYVAVIRDGDKTLSYIRMDERGFKADVTFSEGKGFSIEFGRVDPRLN